MSEAAPALPPVRLRVVLWIAPINAAYLDALRQEGIEVVAALHNDGLRIVPPLQDSRPDICWFTVHDLFHGNRRLSGPGQAQAPAAWIDDASFRQYALCMQRVGFHPGSEVMEALSGGIAAASDIEDWARLHLNHGLRLLEAVAADEVWFDVNPHLGVDNMLALAAIRSGRECRVIEQVRFAPKFSCTGLGQARERGTRGLEWKPWTAGASEPDISYMRENVGRAWNRGLGERLRFLWRSLARGGWAGFSTRVYLGARKRRQWWLMYLLEQLDPRSRLWAAARLQQRRRYAAASRRRPKVAQMAELGDFVYFPLHLEPEANVHVAGGGYRNQLDAIVDLHQALPPGWSIALKENPKQTWMHRGEAFDARLAELPRVRWVEDRMPSAGLIAQARVVATITGTAGYEALRAGKPCVYFGRPWYAGLPGAIRFEPGLDLEEISHRQVPRAALDEAVNLYLGGLADGLAHPRFAGHYEQTDQVGDLYREAARSLARISIGPRTAAGSPAATGPVAP